MDSVRLLDGVKGTVRGVGVLCVCVCVCLCVRVFVCLSICLSVYKCMHLCMHVCATCLDPRDGVELCPPPRIGLRDVEAQNKCQGRVERISIALPLNKKKLEVTLRVFPNRSIGVVDAHRERWTPV